MPAGTELVYAGRTTTEQLGLATPGDQLGDDPADVYVTRWPVELEGRMQGPLVCALYVDSGFLEITEVPLGWEPPPS